MDGGPRQCGITPGRHAGNLLIDSETYFTFMENPMPQHELGVLSPQFHGVITDPIAYLKSRGSSGIILGCKWLPPELRRHAHSQGEFCCLAPPGW